MSYFKSLESVPEMDSNPIGVSFSTLEYTHSTFLEKLENGTFSRRKVQSIILNNVDVYLNYDGFRDPNSRSIFQRIWLNFNFLDALCTLLYMEGNTFYREIESRYIRDINVILYDCISLYTSKALTVSDRVIEKMKEIIRIINHNYHLRLIAYMPEQAAEHITSSFFSSFDKKVCVIRVVRSILHHRLNPDQIIQVLFVFYSNNFTEIFLNMMIARNEIEDCQVENEYKSNLIYAVMQILESMPTSEIIKVLEQYSSYLSLTNTSYYYFSLQKLPVSYPKLSTAIKEVEQRGYAIP